MGFSLKKAVKSVTKAVTKPVTNVVKSTGKAGENYVSGAKHLVQGDISGAISKVGNVLENAGNVASYGTVDLTGRKDGFVNIDADKYADAAYGAVKSLVGANKVKDKSTAMTDTATDGLLQYVSDLRTRKARRNRASTNNTAGSASSDANKLSGTTALGV